MPKKLYIVTQSVFNIQHFVSVTYTALLQFDVGVRNLIAKRKKYLFRSLCTKNPTSLDLSDFFIQAAGLAYHQPLRGWISSRQRRVSHHAPACIFLRLDDIQHFVLIICNSCGIDYIHAFGVIGMRECEKLLNCFTKYDIMHVKSWFYH